MKKLFLLFPVVLLLAGCVSIPTYQPKDINKTVLLKLDKSMDSPGLYVGTKAYNLNVDKDGYTRIPYGQCISLAEFYDVSQTSASEIRTDSCSPMASFTPQKGQKYYANFSIKGKECRVSLFRYSPKSRIGMVPVKLESILDCVPPEQRPKR